MPRIAEDIDDSPRLPPRRGPKRGRALLIFLLLLAAYGLRVLCSWVIEYHWWSEMQQVPTWVEMILYGTAPVAAAALLAFALLWLTHVRALQFVEIRLRRRGRYVLITSIVLFVVAVATALATIDPWTVMRYFGGRGLTSAEGAWRDPVFSRTLPFYLFELPFYFTALKLVQVLALLCLAVYWITARAWQLKDRLLDWRREMGTEAEFDPRELLLEGAANSPFLRAAGSVFLLGLAARYFLERYGLLLNDHNFLVGVDYVSETINLPLTWVEIGACIVAAGLLWTGRLVLALTIVVVSMGIAAVAPRVVNRVYVRPNEISLQRPYIKRHIEATRSAYGLSHRARIVDFAAKPETQINPAQHKAVFDNVRLWDWRAFHDTVQQIQALRPYYVFADSDEDRYVIDGVLRQVLLTPREIDVRQLAEARRSWINPHFIYTHGYGVVMAEANRITADGLPSLFVQNAPPEIKSKSLKLTRPEIYYGESTHEPVFVRTSQPEFNYPSGADNVHSRYEGTGGFPISSLPMRAAAAVAEGEWNILLTGYLTPESRMMIRRRVRERLKALAGFLAWDPDPYLVLTDAGRLVWMVDGYTTSHAHPYSRSVRMPEMGEFNYIRNAVKATVDAYDGTTHLYVFDPEDPIIQAYQALFPQLLERASLMPPDLRAHARYPELIFRAQAESYRTFHMTDPDSFYNKEDLWDLARSLSGQEGRPEAAAPTYVVAALPGETKPEFLLILPFTPRGKENLIGLMVARCDGDRLGELVFLQLSKQELIYGPMQIKARINQDQTIAKDLTLWNQQGSQVLRGQMLVLPVENTFVYIEPIYIQAAQAPMPQLKKVALAIGNRVIYRDTYEEAIAELGETSSTAAAAAPAPTPASAKPAQRPPESGGLEAVRRHLQRYRELAAQGRYSEAGKELEAAEAAARK